jgi:hypothetical protein
MFSLRQMMRALRRAKSMDHLAELVSRKNDRLVSWFAPLGFSLIFHQSFQQRIGEETMPGSDVQQIIIRSIHCLLAWQSFF